MHQIEVGQRPLDSYRTHWYISQMKKMFSALAGMLVLTFVSLAHAQIPAGMYVSVGTGLSTNDSGSRYNRPDTWAGALAVGYKHSNYLRIELEYSNMNILHSGPQSRTVGDGKADG